MLYFRKLQVEAWQDSEKNKYFMFDSTVVIPQYTSCLVSVPHLCVQQSPSLSLYL